MRIDGKQLASDILIALSREVSSLKANGITPHLVVILVGNDPASEAYVRQKKLKGETIGIQVTIDHYDEKVSQEKLLSAIEHYNTDNGVHGIIVQQPLPDHIDVEKITEATDPRKDVDGFHHKSNFTPPIAEGVEVMLQHIADEQGVTLSDWLKQQSIVVIGKGETGGVPIIQKLRKLGVGPIIIDSKTQNSKELKQKADIIISCVGKEGIITPDTIKKGVILFSIGMFRGTDGKFHGDYNEEVIKNIALYYTPVPGGVGPMNVAMLLKNVIDAAKKSTSS